MGNRNTFRNVGLFANSAYGVVADSGMRVRVVGNNARRFVNARPRFDRKNNENKNWKAAPLKNYQFSSEVMNDKNAAMRAAKCPALRRRITKLHRANLKRLRATNTKAN